MIIQNIIFNSVDNITRALKEDLFYTVDNIQLLIDLKDSLDTLNSEVSEKISLQLTFDQNQSEPRIISLIGNDVTKINTIESLYNKLKADIIEITNLVIQDITNQTA